MTRRAFCLEGQMEKEFTENIRNALQWDIEPWTELVFYFILFLYLAVLGLSCGMQALHYVTRALPQRHTAGGAVGSVVAAQTLSCSEAGEILIPPRDQTWIPCIARQITNPWTTSEVSYPTF